ncbi:ABC transporter substrate-binding protein [Streptomyces sp. TP-A0874]|uniref:ABC transporter substrate-binding protein n=1 Tax=Streptomyces sp. TP-A0874 TaxID=549819 RepID=UPI000853DFB6|nr:iron-siderophore ABC transporter substrate-binding protein [Streptomyces sp. TP-A0874]
MFAHHTPRTGLRRRAATATATALVGCLALTACGADSGSDEANGGAKAQRTVKTAMGDVRVSEAPRRVVVLDTAELDSAITLGVKPVGATNAGTSSGFLSYLDEDEVSGVKNVGTIGSPNLEAINALKPDLILSSKVRDEKNYKNLSQIAPTVLTETTGYPWKENFQVHAEALGKQAEAEKVLADYEKHTREVTEALGGADKAGDTEVSVVRFVEGADTRLYGEKNYIGTILEDVGLARPAITAEAPDGFALEVSPEQIDKGDADTVFYATYGDPDKAKEKQITGGGLWKNMKAVRNRSAFPVDDELWIQGIGYTAADKILDELQEKLTS